MAGVVGVIGLAGAVVAEEPAVGASASVPLVSSYVWRGQVLNDEAAVQPSIAVEKGGFGFSTWGSYNLTDDAANGNNEDFSEVDLTLSYARTVGQVELEGGVIDYLFPNTELVSTRELYLSAGYTGLPVTPSVAMYYDVKEVDGFYATAGLSYSLAMCEKCTLDTGVSLGYGSSDYNAYYFQVDDEALNDLSAVASLTYAMTEKLSVTPGVAYSMMLDDEIKDAAEALYGDDQKLVGSVSVNYVF